MAWVAASFRSHSSSSSGLAQLENENWMETSSSNKWRIFSTVFPMLKNVSRQFFIWVWSLKCVECQFSTLRVWAIPYTLHNTLLNSRVTRIENWRIFLKSMRYIIWEFSHIIPRDSKLTRVGDRTLYAINSKNDSKNMHENETEWKISIFFKQRIFTELT